MYQVVILINFAVLAFITKYFIGKVRRQEDGIFAVKLEELEQTKRLAEEKLVSLRETQLESLLQKASASFERKRFKEAKNLFRQVLELDPDHAGALQALGIIALKEGQIDTGIENLEKAHKLDPLNAGVLANLGLAYFNKGYYEKSIESYEHSLAIEDVPRRHYNLALAYKEADKPKKYLAELKKLTALDLKPEYFNMLADAAVEAGDLKTALAAYEKVLELDRSNSRALRELSRIKSRLKK